MSRFTYRDINAMCAVHTACPLARPAVEKILSGCVGASHLRALRDEGTLDLIGKDVIRSTPEWEDAVYRYRRGLPAFNIADDGIMIVSDTHVPARARGVVGDFAGLRRIARVFDTMTHAAATAVIREIIASAHEKQ